MFSKRITIYSSLCAILLLLCSHIIAQDHDETDDWVDATPEQIAKALDWHPTPNVPTICKGYYRDKPIITPKNSKSDQTFVHGDNAILRQNKPSEIIGNVEVTQIGRQLTGNKAISYYNKKTKKIERIDVLGNVYLRQPGLLAVGNRGIVFPQKKTAALDNAIYRYQIPQQPREKVYNKQHQLKSIYIKGRNYRGDAKQIHQDKPQHIIIHNATLTTCSPNSNAWHMSSTTLKLDKKSGNGTAYNALLFINHIPIFYTPFIQFPIDNRRKSGFLAPNIGYSSSNGLNLTLPYYWNMAPNYDMTITPNYFHNRGVKLDTLFRYLDFTGSGQAYFSYLPNDKAFTELQSDVANGKEYQNTSENLKNTLLSAPDNRFELAWEDSHQYTDNLQTNIDIDYVNDDEYLLDFPNAPLRTNTDLNNIVPTTQLHQVINANYATNHWTTDIELENFQSLHPISLPEGSTRDQYARAPDLDLTGIYPDFWRNLNFNFNGEISHFIHPLLQRDYITDLPSVTGYRYNMLPSIDLYLAKAWGYVDPKITDTQSFYDLDNPVINQTNPDLSQKPYLHRNVPIFDIDSGLYFDRNTTIDNVSFIQTLEPRLFYLYAPFVNQDNFPNFDTSLSTPSSFDQLFDINRFQGDDRYGDANHLAWGLTSRLIENKDGQNVLAMSIGQIVYFENRDVTLSGTPSNLDTDQVSPLIGQVAWQLTDGWNLTGNLAYDTARNFLNNSNISLQYNVNNNKYLDAGYTFIRNGETSGLNLKQVNLGLVWPIGVHWHTIGGVVYNISREFPQTYIYGLQYDSCCWAVRVLGAKRFLGFESNGTSPKYDPGVYVQFELTGLTTQGFSSGRTSAIDVMQYTLPGYTDNFGKNPLLQQ